jgi:hypothetical protein
MTAEPMTWREWLTKSRAQAAATVDAWRQATATLAGENLPPAGYGRASGTMEQPGETPASAGNVGQGNG